MAGLATGLETTALLNPDVGNQEQVFPNTVDAPITVLPPKQIAVLIPALAAGRGFNVTLTVFDLLQPVVVIVSVSVQVVVSVGLAVGFETVVELNPVAGDQEYVSPETDAAPINTLLPLHKET